MLIVTIQDARGYIISTHQLDNDSGFSDVENKAMRHCEIVAIRWYRPSDKSYGWWGPNGFDSEIYFYNK
jgi:hypothetical protein